MGSIRKKMILYEGSFEVGVCPRIATQHFVGTPAGGKGWRPQRSIVGTLMLVGLGLANIEQIAARQKCSTRQVNMTISLAFLAPDLVKAAVEGRLPRGIGVERLSRGMELTVPSARIESAIGSDAAQSSLLGRPNFRAPAGQLPS
jgi:hypothetical protein